MVAATGWQVLGWVGTAAKLGQVEWFTTFSRYTAGQGVRSLVGTARNSWGTNCLVAATLDGKYKLATGAGTAGQHVQPLVGTAGVQPGYLLHGCSYWMAGTAGVIFSSSASCSTTLGCHTRRL